MKEKIFHSTNHLFSARFNVSCNWSNLFPIVYWLYNLQKVKFDIFNEYSNPLFVLFQFYDLLNDVLLLCPLIPDLFCCYALFNRGISRINCFIDEAFILFHSNWSYKQIQQISKNFLMSFQKLKVPKPIDFNAAILVKLSSLALFWVTESFSLVLLECTLSFHNEH